MDEMIAYCGLVCHTCQILQVTREEDSEKKAQMIAEIVEQCKKHYGVEHKPEDITGCDGCLTENGRLFSGCKDCQIRKCAKAKGIESCAYCNEYPCEKLEKFFVTEPDAKRRLEQIRNNS